MSEVWHAAPGDIARYSAGAIDDIRAASIEAHLVACAYCREQAAGVADQSRLDATWAEIVETVESPRPTIAERLLGWMGVRADTARLLAATPSLQASWLLAVVVALGFATVAAQSGTERGLAVFLIVAPLLPMAGVAAAFGRELNPAWEITAAAPAGGLRLLLVRASAVFATTLAVAAAACLALPGLSWATVAWVVPALALTLASLALSTFITPERASIAVAVTWVVVVVASAQGTRNLLSAFSSRGQLVLATVALASAILATQRRDSFEIRSHL